MNAVYLQTAHGIEKKVFGVMVTGGLLACQLFLVSDLWAGGPVQGAALGRVLPAAERIARLRSGMVEALTRPLSS